jgi:ComF family protein
VYPPICLVCNEPLLEGQVEFCERCVKALTADPQLACPRCAATVGPFTDVGNGCPACHNDKLQFDAAVRLGVYHHDGPLGQTVLRMKSAAGEILAYRMGRLWARQRRVTLDGHKVQFVVPVPLHWWRRWRRGYNQSAALAEGLADELRLPLRLRWLRRTRYTPIQTGQTTTNRRANVHDAFRAVARAELRGAAVLLVDDVLTTGSTCNEAAKALRRAGAARIIVAALSRGTS